MSRTRDIPYPLSRRFTADLGKIGRDKHCVRSFLEVDVTEARQRIRHMRKTGERVSFLAWGIKVLADTVAVHPEVAGVNRPARRRVTVFEDVDVSLVAEKTVEGSRVPLPFVIRQADRKTPGEILGEIEAAKAREVKGEGDVVLGQGSGPKGMALFARLPQGLRIFVMRAWVLRNPRRMKAMMGNVMVTTVGMAGHARGWIQARSMHPLSLAFGSLNEQAAVRRGEIRKREILHLTVSVDHDVVDGMPAARFVNDLVQRMENGYGLKNNAS